MLLPASAILDPLALIRAPRFLMLLRRTGEMTTPTLPRVTFKLAGGLGGKGSGEQLGHTERCSKLQRWTLNLLN